MKGKVNILLSTYNGEKYLGELLESLISQTYKNIAITIRDDGSTDRTKVILEEYANNNTNITLDFSDNLGVTKSFFTLLMDADSDCEYFCFCDQDDVWMDNKVEKAIDVMDNITNGSCAMYCSHYIVVDERLKPINSAIHLQPRPSFYNALIENIATGCTIMFNNNARSILIRKIPEHAMIHDWWVYLVVSAFGEVLYDPTQTLLYRQHSSNVIGINFGLSKWQNRLSRYQSNKGRHLRKQVEEFSEIYGSQLDLEKMKCLDWFLNSNVSVMKRFYFVAFGKTYRQLCSENMIYKFLYLINYI